jgi:hypothetical protein
LELDHLIRKRRHKEVWQKYCSFVDLSIEEYMEIQCRLMLEQIEIYSKCELGRRIMKTNTPKTISEFRSMVPLTTYYDYADILLNKVESALPAKPVIWIETTWEGGSNPIKTAPYTEDMVENHMGTFVSSLIFATSGRKGHFSLRPNDTFLFGMAPLPYFTGIIPHTLSRALTVNFLPPTRQAEKMSFSERNKVGFGLGLKKGIDLFFGMGSIIVRMSEQFAEAGSSGGVSGSINPFTIKPGMLLRIIRAKSRSKATGQPVTPGDIWKPKALLCGGTDTRVFKRRIEEYWGVRPLELFGGTEPTCIATELWNKNGMVLFPEVCFYEFIPVAEMEKNLEDPNYIPRTFLMNEVVEGDSYEIVISNFKGGAFMRYRVGDIMKCVSVENKKEGIRLPQFAYIDRIPTVIDIAGFTRITENTITRAIELSKLDIQNWFAIKRYDQLDRPYLNLMVEVSPSAAIHGTVVKKIMEEQLSIYFKYLDSDYQDLKKLLGIDPLVITLLPMGATGNYYNRTGKKLRRMNPSPYDITELVNMSREDCEEDSL